EEFAPDYAQVLDELASLLVRIGLKQAVSDFEGDELYGPDVLDRLAQAISAGGVQLFYQTAITGRRDLGLPPGPRHGFEMTLLRMIALRPLGEGEQARGAAGGAQQARAAAAGTGLPLGGGAAATRTAAAGNRSAGAAGSGPGANGGLPAAGAVSSPPGATPAIPRATSAGPKTPHRGPPGGPPGARGGRPGSPCAAGA